MISLRVMYQIKNMKKLFILLLFVILGQVSFGQVYQLMPQYGYQVLRMSFDSTLQIPTTCGVPTLKSVYNVKRGAIAFDSCNNRFYTYNPKTTTWSFLGSGGTTDTTSLSNRINQRIDSLKRSRDSVFARKNGVFVFQYKDSVGGGGATPSLQQVTNVDSVTTNAIKVVDNSNQIFKTTIGKTDYNVFDHFPLSYNDYNYVDPLYNEFYISMYKNGNFYPQIRSIDGSGANSEINFTPDTIALKSYAQNETYILPQTISGTAHTNYLPSPLSGGGSSFDNPYGQLTDTLATLQSVRRLKEIVDEFAIDTTGAFLISVSQPNDSTLTFKKGAVETSYTIRSSIAGSATRLVTSVYNNSGSTIPKGSVIYINGRHSSNLPTIALAQANTEANSYTTFALTESNIANGSSGVVIQAGNITNLNLPTASYTDGQVLYLSPTIAGGYTTTKPLAPYHIVKLGTITRAHPTFGTIELKIENGWQLDELSDVSIPIVPADSVVLQFSRFDSLWHDVSINNAIGTKYIRPSDTSVLQRKSVAAYSFHVNNTSGTANVTDQVFKDLGNQTYSGTITWTGTTAPSGTTNHKYRFVQIGKQVTLTISLNYGTAGSALTAVKLTLPSDCPSPTNFGTLTAANDIIGSAWAFLGTSTSSATTGRVLLQNNAGNNGYEFNISSSSGSFRTAGFTLTYFTD